MRAAIIMTAALLLGGCGATCVAERTTVEGLRAVVESADEGDDIELAESSLSAAELALEACEERVDGQWFEQIIALVFKVTLTALLD